MKRFRICVSSPPDRERLVAEVFFRDEQLADVNQEAGRWSVELYPRLSGKPWTLPFDDTVIALRDAKTKLGG
jgi:hypothetical protein